MGVRFVRDNSSKALATPYNVYVRTRDFLFSRERVREAAAGSALDMIRRYLTDLAVV